MIRGLEVALLVAATATALAGSADAGLYSPPPGDSRPVWSPDGSVIVYATARAPQGLHVIRPDGSDDHPLPGFSPHPAFAFAPDWSWIAFADFEPTIAQASGLFVSRPDGTGRRLLAASDGGRPSWSPDGRRLAFASPEPNEPSDVFTVGVDGSGLVQVAEDGFSPLFSPDGTRIAYVASGARRPAGTSP